MDKKKKRRAGDWLITFAALSIAVRIIASFAGASAGGGTYELSLYQLFVWILASGIIALIGVGINAVSKRKEKSEKRREEHHGAATTAQPETNYEIYGPGWMEKLNALVDRMRIGNIPTNKEYVACTNVKLTIKDMFREVDTDGINKYLEDVSHQRTDQYPLEYFKGKGFTYTGDVIKGWGS